MLFGYYCVLFFCEQLALCVQLHVHIYGEVGTVVDTVVHRTEGREPRSTTGPDRFFR